MIQEKLLKVTWVNRYIESDNVTHWKVLLNCRLPPLRTMGNDFFKCNLSKEDFLKLFGTTLHSRFWIDCISYWCEYNYNENVNEITEISEQPSWYNSHIKIKNKPVFYKLVFDSGIRTVGNVIDNKGRMLSYGTLCEK